MRFAIDDYDELEGEYAALVEKFIDDYGSEYDRSIISLNVAPTIIHGFGNNKKVTDSRVYREGMAIKFFGDLVCDFLDEPRIKRVY